MTETVLTDQEQPYVLPSASQQYYDPAVELTSEQVIELKALAAVLNKSQVADYFGISENTLRAIEKRQPEVSEAYKKAALCSHRVDLTLSF